MLEDHISVSFKRCIIPNFTEKLELEDKKSYHLHTSLLYSKKSAPSLFYNKHCWVLYWSLLNYYYGLLWAYLSHICNIYRQFGALYLNEWIHYLILSLCFKILGGSMLFLFSLSCTWFRLVPKYWEKRKNRFVTRYLFYCHHFLWYLLCQWLNEKINCSSTILHGGILLLLICHSEVKES